MDEYSLISTEVFWSATANWCLCTVDIKPANSQVVKKVTCYELNPWREVWGIVCVICVIYKMVYKNASQIIFTPFIILVWRFMHCSFCLRYFWRCCIKTLPAILPSLPYKVGKYIIYDNTFWGIIIMILCMYPYLPF